MIEYDYTTQRYLEGEAARALRIAHLEEELAILTGPGAADYIKMMRNSRCRAPIPTPAQAADRVRRMLAETRRTK